MDLEGKSWEELCLIAFKSFNKRKKKISQAIEWLNDLDDDICIDEISDYIESLKNNIHIPRWNIYPSVTPDGLNIHAESYHVFVNPDFFLEARWIDGNFHTFNPYRESGNDWELEEEVSYWIPITYPTPY